MKNTKWWTRHALSLTSFVALGRALPLSVPSSLFIRAGDHNGTDPPQFGGGLSKSVFVQVMGKVLCP